MTVHRPCRDSMRRQIQMEVAASLQYLAMGAHFSRDGVSVGSYFLGTEREEWITV